MHAKSILSIMGALVLIVVSPILAAEVQTLDIGPDQNWTFAKENNIELEKELGTEGLVLRFQAGAEPQNNFFSAGVIWNWAVPASGKITVEARAEKRHAHYFAIRVYTNKNKSYAAVFGTPGKGFLFTPELKTGEVSISEFRDAKGGKLTEGEVVNRIALEFAIEPSIGNVVYVNKLVLNPNPAD